MSALFAKIFIPIFLAVSLLMPAGIAYAQDTSLFKACDTNAQTKNSSVCKDKGTTKNPVNRIINVAANIIAILTGIAAVITIIISGFMFITAGGGISGQRSSDPNRLKTARATLTAAIIGLVIVALAWAIVTFLTDKLIPT